MDDLFRIVGAFLDQDWNLYYNGQFLFNLTVVYYELILIHIVQFQDISYLKYFP